MCPGDKYGLCHFEDLGEVHTDVGDLTTLACIENTGYTYTCGFAAACEGFLHETLCNHFNIPRKLMLPLNSLTDLTVAQKGHVHYPLQYIISHYQFQDFPLPTSNLQLVISCFQFKFSHY